jgi:hypothetical protein
MKDTNNTSQIRVTMQARAHLDLLVPAVRKARGLNVSMTDLVSEYILSQPIPRPQAKPAEKKRPRRKPVTPMSQVVPVVGA